VLKHRRLFFLLAIVAVSCVAVREGVQYKEPFRGRWWNYYDRGRWLLDQESWADAEQDLRVALGGRSKDQFWPRTYGLHFLPEYFPHRELGIVLYHQERLSEAISELDTSWSQQPSARAAYYLDEVRAKLIESSNADATPPEIEIISPKSASPVAAIKTELVGVVRDDTFVKGITIDGSPYLVEVSAKEIPFSHAITLLPGDNEIEMVAEDLTGKRTTRVVRIESDVDGPAMSFDAPVEVPGSVTGVAFDPAGVASVRIAGKPASLSAEEAGLVKFSVDLARADLTPPLQYESGDSYGNITRGRLPLDTLVLSSLPPQFVFASRNPAVAQVSDGVQALILGGEVLALSTSTSKDGSVATPEIDFENLRDGQRYLKDNVHVRLDIYAPNPIREAVLKGSPLRPIRGRKTLHITRNIPLDVGENQISASATDVEGLVGEKSVTIERDETKVEELESKLNIAIPGIVWQGNIPARGDELEVMRSRFSRELDKLDRFGKVLDRDDLGLILDEQELNLLLVDKKKRLVQGEIKTADVMFIGRARRDPEIIEIVMQAFSTETGIEIASADVAGRANDTDELEQRIRKLAQLIEQEFPRVQGGISLVKDPKTFVATLGKADRVKQSMKYVVYRYGEEIINPITNESQGRDTDIVCEALIRSVAENASTAETSEEALGGNTIERGHFVVTK